MNLSHDRYRRFVELWKSEAATPPCLDAGQAAHRVLARISSTPVRHDLRPLGWLLATAAVLAFLVAILFPSHAPRRPASPAAITPASGVAVFWLDDATPLYMNLATEIKEGEDS
ncbi:MAG: hypothetical protein GXP48_08290 [Acidobacteria bacterium]|nr:hypothetical protein [Acidobacteriota bacterium]